MEKDWADLMEKARETAGYLKILSHEIRLLTLCHLASGEKTVQELESFLGTSQSNMSQHLAKMRGRGIIDFRKAGNLVYYRVADANILKLMKNLQDVFCKQLPGRRKK
jgi:ArsR family transcriptional regulator